MAAPLPTGAQIRTLPVLPQVDPRLFAPDVGAAMQNAAVGLKLGQELARLGDLRAQIELERKKRKAEMAATDYKLFEIDHAREFLPKQTQAAIEQANAQRAAAINERMVSEALAQSKVPEQQATLTGVQLGNAITSARADQTSGFAGLNTPQKAGSLAAAQSAGQNLFVDGKGNSVLPGGMSSLATSAFMGRFVDHEMVENQNDDGSIDQIRITRDKMGNELKREKVATRKTAETGKPAAQMAAEAQGLVTAFALLQNFTTQLDRYKESGKDSNMQSLATLWANTKPTGIASFVKQRVGRAVQEGETAAVASSATQVSADLKKALFGTVVTPEEFDSVASMFPQPTDDAETMAERLQSLTDYLNARAEPLKQRKIFERLQISLPGHNQQVTTVRGAAQKTKASLEVMSAIESGVPLKGPDGKWYRLWKDAQGNIRRSPVQS